MERKILLKKKKVTNYAVRFPSSTSTEKKRKKIALKEEEEKYATIKLSKIKIKKITLIPLNSS